MTKVIALDAGHGLKTSGKQTPDGIKEWTLNDKVRDKVVNMLKDYDVSFIFPDNNDGSKDESLTSRRTMYVNAKVDAAVSIHHNANTGTWNSATGVEVYTDNNALAADTVLAAAILTRLAKYTGLKSRGVKRVNFSVINQNSVPAVLVEGGFMDGKKDYKVITSDAGQTAYAKAIAEALIEFLELKKKVVKPTATSFKVKVKIKDLNIRKGPGTNYGKNGVIKPGVYTIVETKSGKGSTKGWGRLKTDGVGWISLDFVTKV